ncbi:MAG: PIG-L deacetylase family protein [Methanobacteriota archaeon]
MRILILSPHTDDAEVGCGGTIARFLEEKHEVLWMAFSTAEESLPEGLPKDTLRHEFLSVVRSLGLTEKNCRIFGHKVRRLHEVRQQILEELVKARKDFAPDLVLQPSLKDFHQDHEVVANEAVRAFKTSASILGYELPWNHLEFSTGMFVRLEERHLDKKYELMGNYKSQFLREREYFSKEFIFGLAKVRGVQCGAPYAEAFEVVRWMI